MTKIFLALAGLALSAAVPAWAAENARPSKPASSASKSGKPKSARSKSATSKAATPAPDLAAEAALLPSVEAGRVVDWVAASGDNRALPYAIIDKKAAALFLFDGNGKPLGRAPVLIGIAPGDDATPGVGTKNLAEIGPAEKTTPAGRYLAKYGLAAGRQKVLWIDYATSVALHPIPPGATKKERRRERILSPGADDNRITFGCVNVPAAFYGKSVRPLFQRKGGIVYILPDTKPIEDVFPRLRVQAVLEGGAL
ncbi:hypothetical protein [Allosphingosinicella deserti]|uniref:L,D-transpeptidase n=1 Tax=Allosphingosinicella deserti TaxID=2116704 RepID=A0A2P7QM15_9SPHN|nr:hypothetical protein [Sphingomonas deserti]PSJ39003.1 hypothetical protein C7I55_17040 [Sphingomonas deserti]